MSIQAVYYSLISVLVMAGYALFLRLPDLYTEHRITLKRNRLKRIRSLMYERINDRELNETFARSGVPLPGTMYQLLRLGLICIGIAVLFLSLEAGRVPWARLFYLGAFILLTEPRSLLFGIKSPFRRVMDVLAEHHKYRKNLEIYQAISQLKNLASVEQKKAPGSLFILEQLGKFSRLTRPVFNQMLLLWQSNEKEEACEYFKQAIGTKEGEHVANLLLKLDELKPVELKSQLVLFQEELKRQRETEKMKSNQRKAYVIYAFVVTSAFLIIVNFMTVSFFIEFLVQTSLIQ